MLCCWASLCNFAGWLCPAGSASWCRFLVLVAVSWVCLALLCLLLGVSLFCWLLARSALLGPVLGVTFQFCWLLVGFTLLVVLLGVAFKFSWLLTGSALLVLLAVSLSSFIVFCWLLAGG